LNELSREGSEETVFVVVIVGDVFESSAMFIIEDFDLGSLG
jgi:hypothetical protein